MIPLGVYLLAQAASFVFFGVWFLRHYRRKSHGDRCAMCGQPGRWRYQEHTLCDRMDCLDQAEAEHQWSKENP